MAEADKSSKRSVRNLVGSLAVTCAVAAVFYVAFVPQGDGDDAGVQEVSFSQELDQARRVAPYAVSAPEGLPKDWRATSVRYDADGEHGTTWHIGFVTPDDEYVAVEQGSGRRSGFVSAVTQDARATGGSRSVSGQEWERYEGPEYDALVHEGDGVTTVVTGTGTFGQLVEMAAALEAEKH